MNEKKKKGLKARIIRDITGILLVLQCVTLIAFFGLMPLVKYDALPILKDKTAMGSIYQKGSLAFVQETDPAKLKAGSVAVYYSGDTPIGAKVLTNDSTNGTLLVSGGSGTTSVSYRKISGRGTSFSVPLLGGYANWLVNGIGVNVTVITMGVLFMLFAVSAFLTQDDT